MLQTRTTKFIFLFLMLAPVFYVRSASADEIRLGNGDTFTGTVTAITNQRLTFRTAYAGEIIITADEITEIKTSAPIKLSFNAEDEFIGQIETRQKRIRLVTAQTIYYFRPQEVSRLRTLTDQEMAVLGKFSRPMVWDHEVEIGAQIRSGNTSAQDVRAGYSSLMTKNAAELGSKIKGAYGRTNGERSTQQILGESRLDWSHSDRFYSFYALNGEHDMLRNLYLRSREEGGVGYRVIKTVRSLLQGDVGLGLSEEIFKNAKDDIDPLGHLGALFKQKVGKYSEFGLKDTFLPDFSDPGEFLNEAEGWFLTPVTERFLIRLSVLDRYDSNPVASVKKNDVTFGTSLVFVF